eukprot:GGOE01041345.1.p1 GENE.GGOE01041345.1~~GGOE01041345.1.p1  ORF type:complete len:471 (-),score=145.50 GGOE01041345.1:109-1365(-)
MSNATTLGRALHLLNAIVAHSSISAPPYGGGLELVHALVLAMGAHPQDTALGAMACTVALPFLNTVDGQRRFVAAGGIPEVLQRMHLCPDDERIQRTCCAVVGELATSRDHIYLLHSENAMDVVVASMRWNVAQPDVLQHHLRLLRRLTANDAMRQAAVQQGALEGIVSAMQTPLCVGAIREECAWALLDLVYDDVSSARRLVAAGALNPLLDTLTTSIGPTGECMASLKVVAHLLAHDGGLHAQFVRMGELGLLMKGMTMVLADAPMQLEYSSVLASLATREELFDRMGELAIPVLCRTLRQHVANVPILTRCVFTLASLTQLTVNQLRLQAEGGVSLLLELMQQHIGCLELQLQCCKLMHHLASQDEGTREDIILECGVKYICDVMQAHPASAELQQLYLSVLVNLGEEVDVHRLI